MVHYGNEHNLCSLLFVKYIMFTIVNVCSRYAYKYAVLTVNFTVDEYNIYRIDWKIFKNRI